MASSRPANPYADPAILLVPGLGGSGPGHWQTLWEQELDSAATVDLGDWEKPHRNTWVNKLNLAIHRANRPVILVAHSLGCLAIAWWAHYERPERSNPVVGALLVAPPEADFFPRDERLNPFAPVPVDPLPFDSILVASRNDPWMNFHTAAWLAGHWQSDLIDLGDAGHINADSGLGLWHEGLQILDRLKSKISGRTVSSGSPGAIPTGRLGLPGHLSPGVS